MKIPSSATLITNPDDIIISVIEFKEEKIEEPAPAPVEGAAPAAEAEGAAPAAPEAEKKE